MKLLYLDCFSGIAGDMTLGALLDAGADEAFVRGQLTGLGLDGWRLDIEEVSRAGLRARHAVVSVESDLPGRDHAEITRILQDADLRSEVRALSERVFHRLCEAEARVHGIEIEKVHLHEVAAVDAFVDIVGSAAALLSLGPERVLASPVAVGSGTVRSAHGTLPVPPPAVVELLRDVPIYGGGERELVTPTGAAILTSVVDDFGELPAMRLQSSGYGAGTDEREVPNVLRVLLGDYTSVAHETGALLLEANLDDMSPELIPRTIEQLLVAGAYDAWVVPIIMKKGRPAFTLSALVPTLERERVLDVIYNETTTFGVRVTAVDKDELERTWTEVSVEGHTVRVKLGLRGSHVVTRSPEYEDAAKVARATGLPLKDVYRSALIASTEDSPRP